MNPRQYQERHIEEIIKAVSSKRKILMQLPTGGGKTVEFALIVKRYVLNTGKAVMILVHRQELMHQAARTIKDITGYEPYLINAKTNKLRFARVYIGMVDSVTRRLDMFDDIGLVIIDECHIANFNKMHNIFLEELIIGCSATPISSSKKEPMNKYYSDIVAGPQIGELIDQGYLSQNITRCPKDVIDATQFAISRLRDDYDEKQMAIEYKKPKHILNIVQNYRRYCKGKKTLVFNVSIDHSKEVNECFVHFRFNSRHLDSTMDDTQRADTLKWFKETPNAILNNVMITNVGFDEPTVEAVFLNFATLSLVKYIQCCGRAARVINEDFIDTYQKYYPYKLGIKDHFHIIDMGGNWIRFGDWCNDRDWERIFRYPPKPGNGVAPVKSCPKCEGLLHAAIRVCNLMDENGEPCLHEFERKVVEEKDVASELILVTKGLDVQSILDRSKNKYDLYPFFELVKPVVRRLFEQHGNPSQKLLDEAFKEYYQICIAWYKENMAGKDGNIDDITNVNWYIIRAKNNFNSFVERFRSDHKVRPLPVITTMYDKDGLLPMSNFNKFAQFGREKENSILSHLTPKQIDARD